MKKKNTLQTLFRFQSSYAHQENIIIAGRPETTLHYFVATKKATSF